MRSKTSIGAICGSIAVLCPSAFGQGIPADDPVRALVGRLDLERYKATIKGLTEFGDRRQGTDRNRAAIDWIERQLKSFGCNIGRIQYEYNAPTPQSPCCLAHSVPAQGAAALQWRVGHAANLCGVTARQARLLVIQSPHRRWRAASAAR